MGQCGGSERCVNDLGRMWSRVHNLVEKWSTSGRHWLPHFCLYIHVHISKRG